MDNTRLEAFSDGVLAIIITHFAPVPTALYGVFLLMSALAYWILLRAMLRVQGSASLLAKAVGNDFKGTPSLVI